MFLNAKYLLVLLCCLDQAGAVLLTPYRTAATPPVAAGSCFIGTTCRGNQGVVIPSNSSVPRRDMQVLRASLLPADLISVTFASLLT